MIRGTSSGADDVIGNGKCVLSGHLREAIWMIASNKSWIPHLITSAFRDTQKSIVYKSIVPSETSQAKCCKYNRFSIQNHLYFEK